jgi:hypothetical protein
VPTAESRTFFFCTLLLFFFRFGPIFVGKDAFFQKKGATGGLRWEGASNVFSLFAQKKTFSHIISSIVLCARPSWDLKNI